MRTFEQLQDAVRTEMQLDPGLISVEERKQFINNCLNDLGDLALFQKEVEVNCIDGIIELPEDHTLTLMLTWHDGRVLYGTRLASRTYSGNGNPVWFVLRGNIIEVIPRPQGEHKARLFYSYRPKALVNPDDKPDIPNGWDWLIVDYAVAHAHRKNGNIGIYREYMQSYGMGKMALMHELTRQVNSRINTIHDMEHTPMPDPLSMYDLL